MERERDLVGQILVGKLEVIRKLGDGGMGEVYEVEHRLTGHRRALKVVRPEYADRPRFMKRLLREAKVAGTLGSDHVVETYDAGRLENGSAYVLMELLHGVSLYDAMQKTGSIAPRRLVRIMTQVAEGMALAHAAGIIHRDLKPENIFLLEEVDGFEPVKILDFGVSKFDRSLDEAPTRLTAEGTLVGTPYYMSPEQAAGKPVDARSDVYAMGVMIYEALTGRLPFEASSVSELFVKIGAGQCVPLATRLPEIDPRWSEIAHKAFDRAPDERFQDAESLRRALLPLLEGGPVGARAKTISSGPRSTVDYSDPLPSPPNAPRDAATLAGSSSAPPPNPATRASQPPSAPEADEETPEQTAPTETDSDEGAEEPEEAGLADDAAAPDPAVHATVTHPKPGIPSWLWAVAGAAAVLALVAPFAFSSTEPPTAAAPVQTPAEAAPADTTSAPPPLPVATPPVREPLVERRTPEDPTPEEPAPEVPSLASPRSEATQAAAAPLPREPATTPRRRPPPTEGPSSRATSAGLDPNPYR